MYLNMELRNCEVALAICELAYLDKLVEISSGTFEFN